METIFKFGGLTTLPIWALMVFLPRWRWTQRLMRSPWVSAAPAAIYAALVVPRFVEVWQAVSRPELSGVAALLGSPVGATIGWMHFLAFDLFVGRWIYLDGLERGLPAWVMAPTLILTLMLGPCGFLLYLIVRQKSGRRSGSENEISVSKGAKGRS
jgi:hypothetical protein